MKRYFWIVGAFIMVVLLVAVEMAIISNASGYESKEKVVFAAERISKNAIITGDMLELREISTEAVHPDAIKSINIALSKRAVMDIEDGEMLLNVKLSADDDGMIEAVDKNNRLFSLELDVDQANGWQLTEDQYVDIIYVPSNSEVRNQSVILEGKKEIQEGQSIGGAGTITQEKTDAAVTGSTVLEKSEKGSMGAAAQEKSETGGMGAANQGNDNVVGIGSEESAKGLDSPGQLVVQETLGIQESSVARVTYVVPVEVSGGVRVMKHIRIAGIIDQDGKLVDVLKTKSLPRYISFEVTQEQAAFLAYAKRNGKLELACIRDK